MSESRASHRLLHGAHLVRTASGIWFERDESGGLTNLNSMSLIPLNKVFLLIGDRFGELPCPCKFNKLLQTKVKFQRVLSCSVVNSCYPKTVKTRGMRTFIFRKAALFSLHHAKASVQLCLRNASSMRLISENKSISTSFYAIPAIVSNIHSHSKNGDSIRK